MVDEPAELERAVAQAIGIETNLDYDGLSKLAKEPGQIIAQGQSRRLERMARAAIRECFRWRTIEDAGDNRVHGVKNRRVQTTAPVSASWASTEDADHG